MGYRKIPNLYRPEATEAFSLLNKCYAMEKIHGTSAHVAWSKENGFKYFSGGIKHDTFMEMMEKRFPKLESDIEKCVDFASRNSHPIESVVFFGEAYGGKCQKMANVYGDLNFIVFEVKINDKWYDVVNAELWAKCVGLEFVHYEKGPATLEWVDSQRDKFSVQASRNGMGEDKIGEGIVIRATDEGMVDRFGNRIIIKHKRPEFRETKTPREVDPAQQKRWAAAQEVAEEFVVPMRMDHVLDKLKAEKPGFEMDIKNTRTVIGAMTGDIRKEEGDSIEWNNDVQRAIGSATAKLFKERLRQLAEENLKE